MPRQPLDKQPKKSMLVNGMQLLKHDPSAIFKNHKEIKLALFEALMDGDKEAFVDILSGYVRTVVYEAISDESNPSLDTLCKIMTSFKKVS